MDKLEYLEQVFYSALGFVNRKENIVEFARLGEELAMHHHYGRIDFTDWMKFYSNITGAVDTDSLFLKIYCLIYYFVNVCSFIILLI